MARKQALDAIDGFFTANGWTPFDFQREVWDAYAAGESGLVHAATGTGKTYAAYLGPVIEYLTAGGRLVDPHATRKRARSRTEPLTVLWLTPLRALAADTVRALQAPVDALGLPWSVEARTGDTKASLRAKQRERYPTVLVTTPESLTLMLCREDHAERLASLQVVIVDEWHELMATKRGVQVELALARLRATVPALRTWGLSATLGNLPVAAETLCGTDAAGVPNPARRVQGLVPKDVVVEALLPEEMERFPWAGHLNVKLLPQVLDLLASAKSAIVFTNTRSQCELWFQSIIREMPEWFEFTAIHHGSLDADERRKVEEGLHSERFRIVVATSSLDLGVDFSPVDLVLQIGSPKGVARLMQRAGRSGHQPGRPSRIVCVPTHALELVEVSAARDAIAAGDIESRDPLDRPLDVLVQHLVTLAMGGGFTRDAALAELRTTRAYGTLTDAEFDWALDFTLRGGSALAAYPEYARLVVDDDGVHRVANPQVARRHVLAIGTIVSAEAIAVRFMNGGRIGTVEEGFVARLTEGDTFLFAGRVLEFVRVRDLVCWVRKAKRKANAIPRWQGARMPLSTELAAAVRRTLDDARRGEYRTPETQAVKPVLATQAERSVLPHPDELLIERCETREGHHLFVYPFEGRLVHEGLSALFTYRLAQHAPLSFAFACNDYGFELLAADAAPLEEALDAGLLSTRHLLHDIVQSLNAAELAKRQFREVARVAGLVTTGYPGQRKSAKHVQASTSLLYDVFVRYDPDNLLVKQAEREVLERQLEASRMGRVLGRLEEATVRVVDVERPTPLAFPLLIDRTRERLSTESIADRVRRLASQAGRASTPGRARTWRRRT